MFGIIESMNSTIYFFTQLYNRSYRVVPPDLATDLHHALEQLQNNLELSSDEQEQTLLEMAKKTWCYRSAFAELSAVYAGQLGDKFGSQDDIDNYTIQAIHSTAKLDWNKRVAEFQIIFAQMENQLNNLRILAQSEAEHPQLAAEIRAQIAAFEEGICLISPAPNLATINRAHEHFIGRKLDIKRLLYV